MLAKKLKKPLRKSSSTAGFLFVLAATALLYLNSCSENTQESASVPSETKKEIRKKAAEKDSTNQAKEPSAQEAKEIYVYNPNGKVDPFTPMISETIDEDITKKTESKTSERDVPMTPLQKLDVDDFTLVAVIATPTGYYALLEDPAMNGYKVHEGMEIGRKSGVIKKILHNSVIVEENKDIDQKNNEKKINTLTLRKK
jgi:Tfp pilus assembly protein PilP